MKTRDLTKIALLVAMNCVSAYIIIPLPFSMSPLSLQTLMINLVALLLPVKQAALVMTVYLLLGLAGVPVFTGGTAGFAKLLGPTGGYVWAFLPAVALMSWLKGKEYDFYRYIFVAVCIGIPVIYVFGVSQLMLVTGLNLWEAILMGVLPFVVGDIVKAVGAAYLVKVINKML
ncbi:MAG: biotin transporter BioY [Phascolarctobacterium sp.]|nr:biotin transporter BioY [Candidatus Phascolarctobacterium caballi]